MFEKMKSMKRSLSNEFSSEEGFGLVESLIAIILAGVASVALISVAVGVIREANNNQIRDAMNYYAVQGLEEIKTIAAGEDNLLIIGEVAGVTDSGVVCNPVLIVTHYGYHDMDNSAIISVPKVERCSEIGADSGKCERLPMPGRSGDFLFREVSLKGVGGKCFKQRVEVTVGMIANDPGSGEYPRGFISEVSVVGYIAEH